MGVLFYIIAVLMVVLPGTGQAADSYYIWEDPGTGFTLHVPDTWQIVANRNAQDVVTFRAPGQNQHAQCRLRVRDEGRFQIYPESLSDHVVNAHFGRAFWQDWSAREFRHFKIHEVKRDQGLGHGFATRADVSYVPQHLSVHKRGLIWASLYNNTLYVLGCSAQTDSYAHWHARFMRVISTARMRKALHELPGGHYRHFAGDRVLRVRTIPAAQSSNH